MLSSPSCFDVLGASVSKLSASKAFQHTGDRWVGGIIGWLLPRLTEEWAWEKRNSSGETCWKRLETCAGEAMAASVGG